MNEIVRKKALMPYLIVNVFSLIILGICLNLEKTSIFIVLALLVYCVLNYVLVFNTLNIGIKASNESIDNKQPIEHASVTFAPNLKEEINLIVANCDNFKIDNGIEQCAYRLKGLTMQLERGFNVNDMQMWKREVVAFKMEINGVLDVMSESPKYADCRETLQRIDNVLKSIEYAL